MRNLLRKKNRNASGEAATSKPLARMAWDGSPDNLYIEMPHTGVWKPAEPWMYEKYEVRLDPDACDPDPIDL